MRRNTNQNKYLNALLFFMKYCNNYYLGATKLNKLLYYLDFISYRDRKQSVTGDDYLHKAYGPVPDSVDDFIAMLKKDGKIKVETISLKDGEKKDYNPLCSPDVSVFDSYEKELLDKICKEFLLWPTEKMVAQTHLEAPWFYSKPYDVVDYDYANDIEFFLPQ